MNTQDEEKMLEQACDCYELRYQMYSHKTEPEEELLGPEGSRKQALRDIYEIFWKKQPEPVDAPKVGEWWLLTTSGGWVAEQEQLLLRLPNGSWLTRNGWRGAFYIQHPDKLICRVPTRFPRLRKLRDKLRFFFQKISR